MAFAPKSGVCKERQLLRCRSRQCRVKIDGSCGLGAVIFRTANAGSGKIVAVGPLRPLVTILKFCTCVPGSGRWFDPQHFNGAWSGAQIIVSFYSANNVACDR